jgi:hypothetical protein
MSVGGADMPSLQELASIAYAFQAEKIEALMRNSSSSPAVVYRRQAVPPFEELPEVAQEVWLGTVKAILDRLGGDVEPGAVDGYT